MFHQRIGRMHRPNPAPSTSIFGLNSNFLCSLDHNRKNPMQPSCTPFVNLARKPAPMASPSQNQSEVLSRPIAFQKISTASVQKKTLKESIVIRMEPTAIIGMTEATSRHHNATRSSY